MPYTSSIASCVRFFVTTMQPIDVTGANAETATQSPRNSDSAGIGNHSFHSCCIAYAGCGVIASDSLDQVESDGTAPDGIPMGTFHPGGIHRHAPEEA